MEEIKTQGLILTSANLNDNDKIFTIETRDAGKITAISKGIRSHKHKDFAALQNFCYSDMVLSRKTGLYYISSASVVNNFFGIRNSVEQMSFAAYFADVIKSFPEQMPLDDEYFSFVLNTFFLTGKASEKCRDSDLTFYLLRLKTIFEMKTVSFAGFMPSAMHCGICSSKKDIEYFDIANGTVVCKTCNEKSYSDLVKINSSVLNILNFINNSDYRTVFSLNAKKSDIEMLSQISEKYLINSLEIYPGSLTYLKNTVFGQK